ncbi:von Willebrand factor type A domain-containing protein [Falsihalocynthiibacter sp. S25ZX9]|uniref:vWA domain-containing protein n=1 Tax=Falsihalocynthiibacter sp. S25ZX9 TaxID=3240870 RepID=UPI00350ECB91
MNDDLDALKAMMADIPAPDDAKKRADIALAEKNFKNFQGSVVEPRPTSESTPLRAGWISGVKNMFTAMTSRTGLAITTSIAAVGVGVIFVELQNTPLAPQATTSEGAKSSPEESMLAQDEVDDMMVAPADELAGRSIVQMTSPAPATSLSRLSKEAVSIEPQFYFSDDMSESETFSNAAPNPLKTAKEDPVSTFSIDVDTASYAILRSSIANGYLPDPDSVRIEEMINYFPYAYKAPQGDQPFLPSVTVMDTPWNAATQLVHIGIQGALPATDTRPPLNLVFLIDTSGSMQDQNKLPLLKQSFRLMLSELRPEDQVAIVAYAGSAGQVLEPTAASERSTILAALDRLEAGGGTAGQEGLQQAYTIAKSMQSEGEVTRVLLATDGDFNVGIHDPAALKSFIETKRDEGTYLSVLGFGRGNLDDATMQTLAQNGNGQAAYIDTLAEAQKVLVDQLTGALFPIANDVKIQVEFNPSQVAEYRLIGYETRALNREDFNNDKVDAGEIGAGHTVTALYEITPVGSSAIKNDELRYGSKESVSTPSDELGFLKIRYKTPGETQSKLITAPINTGMGETTEDTQFAASMAGFGQLLRDDTYLGDWGWDEAIALAQGAKGVDAFGYRAEAVTLMRLAKSMANGN